MIASRDTFMRFITDNLLDEQGVPIPVHNVRTTDDPQDALVQNNAVNITFGNGYKGQGKNPSRQAVMIDVVNDDERTAVAWSSQVADILLSTSCPKLIYSVDPVTPTNILTAPAGTNLWWKPDGVQFVRITTLGADCRFRCSMTFNHIAL